MTLESGYVVCDKCGGSGYVPVNLVDEYQHQRSCSKCRGTGKLDWVENIIGKRSSFHNAPTATFMMNTGTDIPQPHHKNLIDSIAKKMSDEIDKRILGLYSEELGISDV